MDYLARVQRGRIAGAGQLDRELIGPTVKTEFAKFASLLLIGAHPASAEPESDVPTCTCRYRQSRHRQDHRRTSIAASSQARFRAPAAVVSVTRENWWDNTFGHTAPKPKNSEKSDGACCSSTSLYLHRPDNEPTTGRKRNFCSDGIAARGSVVILAVMGPMDKFLHQQSRLAPHRPSITFRYIPTMNYLDCD